MLQDLHMLAETTKLLNFSYEIMRHIVFTVDLMAHFKFLSQQCFQILSSGI